MNSDSSEDIDMETPSEIKEAAASASDKLLPAKSKTQYERTYHKFMSWREDKKTDSFSENILLEYFQQLSTNMKPTSLWAIYSMLRMTINLKHNVDIGKYVILCAFLKRASDGYRPKKSKILSATQINDFLSSAPDEKYLFTKANFFSEVKEEYVDTAFEDTFHFASSPEHSRPLDESPPKKLCAPSTELPHDTREQQNNEIEHVLLESIKTELPEESNKVEIDNEFVLFGKSVACQLQKLPENVALQSMVYIQSYLVKERLKATNDSLRDNVSGHCSEQQGTSRSSSPIDIKLEVI